MYNNGTQVLSVLTCIIMVLSLGTKFSKPLLVLSLGTQVQFHDL
jgi:hypothetical protein